MAGVLEKPSGTESSQNGLLFVRGRVAFILGFQLSFFEMELPLVLVS